MNLTLNNKSQENKNIKKLTFTKLLKFLNFKHHLYLAFYVPMIVFNGFDGKDVDWEISHIWYKLNK